MPLSLIMPFFLLRRYYAAAYLFIFRGRHVFRLRACRRRLRLLISPPILMPFFDAMMFSPPWRALMLLITPD